MEVGAGMSSLALWVVGLSFGLFLYAYAGYPLLLWIVGRFRGNPG